MQDMKNDGLLRLDAIENEIIPIDATANPVMLISRHQGIDVGIVGERHTLALELADE